MSRTTSSLNFEVVTQDSIGGERTWYVKDVEDEDDASRHAAKAAGLDHIPAYEDYSSDSRYLDDLDRAADDIEIISVLPATGPDTGRPITCAASLLSVRTLEPSAPAVR